MEFYGNSMAGWIKPWTERKRKNSSVVSEKPAISPGFGGFDQTSHNLRNFNDLAWKLRLEVSFHQFCVGRRVSEGGFWSYRSAESGIWFWFYPLHLPGHHFLWCFFVRCWIVRDSFWNFLLTWVISMVSELSTCASRGSLMKNASAGCIATWLEDGQFRWFGLSVCWVFLWLSIESVGLVVWPGPEW